MALTNIRITKLYVSAAPRVTTARLARQTQLFAQLVTSACKIPLYQMLVLLDLTCPTLVPQPVVLPAHQAMLAPRLEWMLSQICVMLVTIVAMVLTQELPPQPRKVVADANRATTVLRVLVSNCNVPLERPALTLV